MSDTPATRASAAPTAPNGPTGGHGDGGAATGPTAARTARIVIHESDACQGNITGRDCEDCEDDACEHECHDTEPTGDLRERLMEALRTVGLARNLAAYRDAVLPVVKEALAEHMDEHGAEQIERIQAERDALPKDERVRLDAADAPMLRIQLAVMARKVAETKAELERTSTAAALEIWHKLGLDSSLHWKDRAENAEDRLRKAEQAYTQLAAVADDAVAARDRWRERAEKAEQRTETAERAASIFCDQRDEARALIPPADTSEAEHTGGNAEDCPICRPLIDQPGGVLYPWHCTAAETDRREEPDHA